MNELHKIQLDILLDFSKFCEENDINYTIAYGSLIGAVRHKGFIPWDDDIDIGMIRSEYVKFLAICKDELLEEYFLQTFELMELYHTAGQMDSAASEKSVKQAAM